MASRRLAGDATITDVLPTLAKPEEYVRVVLGHLAGCNKDNGNAHVRIGVTGTGKFPSHKIVHFDDAGVEHLYGAWGEETPFSDVKIHTDTWSTRTMAFDEVRNLIARIRGIHR